MVVARYKLTGLPSKVNVPIVSEALDLIMFYVVSFDAMAFERALMLSFLSSILSVVWGIYYKRFYLRKFKELRL